MIPTFFNILQESEAQLVKKENISKCNKPNQKQLNRNRYQALFNKRLGVRKPTLLKKNKFPTSNRLACYKEECQRVFDLQNKVLSSQEILSTDDESSDGSGTDVEEMGKAVEDILSKNKTYTEISLEREEQERLELKKMFTSESDAGNSSQNQKKKVKSEEKTSRAHSNRILNIYRTFLKNGQQETRKETVRLPAVIDEYIKIRSLIESNTTSNGYPQYQIFPKSENTNSFTTDTKMLHNEEFINNDGKTKIRISSKSLQVTKNN